MPPTEIKRPIEIPWEEAQALLRHASPAPVKTDQGPTEIRRPVQISMEEARALIARNPPSRAPLFVSPQAVAIAYPLLDRRK